MIGCLPSCPVMSSEVLDSQSCSFVRSFGFGCVGTFVHVFECIWWWNVEMVSIKERASTTRVFLHAHECVPSRLRFLATSVPLHHNDDPVAFHHRLGRWHCPLHRTRTMVHLVFGVNGWMVVPGTREPFTTRHNATQHNAGRGKASWTHVAAWKGSRRIRPRAWTDGARW